MPLFEPVIPLLYAFPPADFVGTPLEMTHRSEVHCFTQENTADEGQAPTGESNIALFAERGFTRLQHISRSCYVSRAKLGRLASEYDQIGRCRTVNWFRAIMRVVANVIPLLLIAPLLHGCARFGEGFARALTTQPPKEDTRRCYVRGQAFDGMQQLIERAASTNGDLKVLMVHGIGTHLPGYSTRLAENLASELQLEVVDRQPKTITLRLALSQADFQAGLASGRLRGQPGDRNGLVSVSVYRSKNGERRMVFYELSWSELTETDKQILAYDSSSEYASRRAGINRELKSFLNSQLPDTLLYLGNAQLNIQLAVTQTLCWMFTQDYGQLAQQTDRVCNFQERPPSDMQRNSYAFISHSMGSRILTDALQTIAMASARGAGEIDASPSAIQWRDTLQAEVITVFMLSNQLPLLQLGRDAPEVTDDYAGYCTAAGAHYGQRQFARTNIVAFSDPNDILSWAVPPAYEDTYMDSRICANLVNVIINVADVKKFLGVELAAPGEAHRGYDNDQRVIKLIAHGMSDGGADPMIKERCQWMEVR